jgi:hypothetical protein
MEDRMHITNYLKPTGLEDALWKTILETGGPVEIRPACERSLRAWITIGIQRMERQRRLGPEDLAIAHASLRKFVDILKKEAVFLGKPNYLDNTTFHAARRRLRRQGSLSAFTLWPFWPHSFVLTS